MLYALTTEFQKEFQTIHQMNVFLINEFQFENAL